VEFEFIKEPHGSLAVPISPTKLFVAVNDAAILEKLRGALQLDAVRHMNMLTVSRARRFVWAQDESSSGFIRKHMSTAMAPKPFFPHLATSVSRDA
jgi:hypothetical protein